MSEREIRSHLPRTTTPTLDDRNQAQDISAHLLYTGGRLGIALYRILASADAIESVREVQARRVRLQLLEAVGELVDKASRHEDLLLVNAIITTLESLAEHPRMLEAGAPRGPWKVLDRPDG